MEKNFIEIEKIVDNWIYDMLDSEVPRNKYIYHCNLAYIDLVINTKNLFSPIGKDFLFSLNYNTFIAHKKLKEESIFDYKFDNTIYGLAYRMIIYGVQYSMLCNIFPMLHSKKAFIKISNNKILFEIGEIPKKNYKYFNDYFIQLALKYNLQILNEKLQSEYDENSVIKLANAYVSFFSENMDYYDFEPYTRACYGGISFYFIVAAMRRYCKLYKKNVNIDSQEMMILLSPSGKNKMRELVLGKDDPFYEKAFEDHIYKPIGENTFPKLSISDAILNRTSDGYIFANPLVILSNTSYQTQFLNYLRRCDNSRYLKIKDKIKEKVIPFIIEMIKHKFQFVKCISNFQVKIPKTTKKRECDLILIDKEGVAIYLEIKHFYNPQSFAETKKVDEELRKALSKIPEQLEAIKNDWESIKQIYSISYNLKELHGVIVSHFYTGFDVPISESFPIINFSNLYENIAESKDLKELYLNCKEIDIIFKDIDLIKKKTNFNFAGYKFVIDIEFPEKNSEKLFKNNIKRQMENFVFSPRSRKKYENISDLAKECLEEINEH